MKIILVEDHPKLRENISRYLKVSGYVLELACNGKEALDKILYNNYDLMILDVNMPIMNGKELTMIIRTKGYDLPIIALTSNSLIEDKEEMYDLGVDDYLTKPFELKELLLRIKALSKRKNNQIDDLLDIGEYTINFRKHLLIKNNIEILLLNKEYLIIEFLAKNRFYPKTKTQILENVWGELENNLDLSSTTLEAHISTIRKKTKKDFIKTIKGVGYIIE